MRVHCHSKALVQSEIFYILHVAYIIFTKNILNILAEQISLQFDHRWITFFGQKMSSLLTNKKPPVTVRY